MTLKLTEVTEEKNKSNAKYIKTIEQLTQQLNNAYGKINEQTRVSKEKNDMRNVSKDKERGRSVNKLKSYFGFGAKND